MSLPIEHDSVSSPHYVPTSDPLEVELVIPPGADVRDSDSATLPSDNESDFNEFGTEVQYSIDYASMRYESGERTHTRTRARSYSIGTLPEIPESFVGQNFTPIPGFTQLLVPYSTGFDDTPQTPTRSVASAAAGALSPTASSIIARSGSTNHHRDYSSVSGAASREISPLPDHSLEHQNPSTSTHYTYYGRWGTDSGASIAGETHYNNAFVEGFQRDIALRLRLVDIEIESLQLKRLNLQQLLERGFAGGQ